MSAERQFSREDILEILPHGQQFMFLESAEVVEKGKRAIGVLADRSRFPFLKDHFPGYLIFPGGLQMEALAELSGIALLSGVEGQKDKIGVLAEDHMKYRGQIFPEDRIELETTITEARLGSGLGFAKSAVTAKKDGKIIAQGEIKFALMDMPKDETTVKKDTGR